MKPKMKLLSLALLAAGVIGIAGLTSPLIAVEPAQKTVQIPANTPDPAVQLKDLARRFRAGDVTGLAQAMVPPSKWEMARTAWEIKRLEPVSEHDRAEFAEVLARVTAPDAVDVLMAEIEPKLEEARPQLPGALLMGIGAAQFAVNSPESELTDEQRAALQSALPGIQGWATSTDFLSSATMRDALTLLTDAARRTGINDIDELKALPLEAVLDRAGVVLAAAKDAAQLYGLDIDAIADSLDVEVLAIDAQTARVRTTVTVFNAPIWSEHDLVLVEGRWVGKHMFEHLHDHHHAKKSKS